MNAGIQKFNQAARNALLQSHVEAVRSGQSKITDLHLLVALVRDEGAAGKVLAEQGANLEKIRNIIDEVVPASEKTTGKTRKIGLDDSIQRVLEQAAKIARQKKSEAIGTEHLLFALVKNPSGRLKTVMEASGLDRTRIRESLDPVLAVSSVRSELPDLLDTLEACRRLFQGDAAAQQRLRRIEEILREYFAAK